jgi:hypothetical protein
MRVERPIPLDFGHLCRKVVVSDGVAEPARIIARLKVMEPGSVVDALGDLDE